MIIVVYLLYTYIVSTYSCHRLVPNNDDDNETDLLPVATLIF